MPKHNKYLKKAMVAQAFSPSAPVNKSDLFAGRRRQVQDIISAVFQRGQHVIIYGERGVGKTSMANVMWDFLTKAGLKGLSCGTINCDATDSFESIWFKVFRELSIQIERTKIGFTPRKELETFSLEGLLPDAVTPDDVRVILEKFSQQSVIIIDEIDRLVDKSITTMLADTLKNLSDHSSDTTVILVGVADSVDELIAEHGSVERALVQIPMPRMSRGELSEIIDNGLKQVSMTIDPSARGRITHVSQGLPHYTHLLALHAAESAVDQGSTEVTERDVDNAITASVEHAQQSIQNSYHRATNSAQKGNLYSKVLLACALAYTDDLGYFSAADVREPMHKVMGRHYEIPSFSRHLNDFCESDRGPVLKKTGEPRRFRFRFVNPLMQPYIIMHGLAHELIDASAVD